MSRSPKPRAVVVTGAAVGIGAAIAEELGRLGVFVVTLDANVTVDGSGPAETAGRTTAERIVDAGGAARSVDCSVTDAVAVTEAFQRVVDDFGALDAVVNVAGISRPTSFTRGSERDWTDVLGVHLDGYLTVLRAALPLMAAAGHGRIVGVTSGSGWRAADAGAYGCAKRAVAALTWQLGKVAPPGVTVNALSPVAATRMVAAAATRAAAAGRAATGGISLAGFPPPDHLGPVGAFLASEALAWCSGRIFFSAGAELALIAEPRIVEAVRGRPSAAPAGVLAEVVPAAFVPAEASQASGAGSNARFAEVFDSVRDERPAPDGPASRSCLVVADDPVRRDDVVSVLERRGTRCAVITDPAGGFRGAAEQFAVAVAGLHGVDAVVVAIEGVPSSYPRTSSDRWRAVLDDHVGVSDRIRGDAAWARAVAEHAVSTNRAVRLVTLCPAVDAGGRSRAQAVAQLSRAARPATGDLVTACSVSCESDQEADRAPIAELVGHLVVGPDTEALAGAELCVGPGWWGLRSHPVPSGTISFGGPSVPAWLNDAVREIVEGPDVATRRGG